jgi:phosphoadenosine phosphosulfate reductase
MIDRPKESMWQLIVRKKTPPMRMSRYCCSELKETKGRNRVVVTGVRWAESARRKANRNLINIGKIGEIVYNNDNDDARKAVENCYRTKTTLVNPVIDWTDEDVWEFIREQNVRYCSLYDEGFKRLGCIGCPMATPENKSRDFFRWPTYKTAYIHAFDRMIEARIKDGKPVSRQFESGKVCFDWWIGKPKEDDTMDGQIEIESEGELK